MVQAVDICLVSREHTSSGQAGGIATYTEKTARALAHLGHSVRIITEATSSPCVMMEDGVTVHYLRQVGGRPRERVWLMRARAVALALAELPSPPDVIQACEFRAEGVWWTMAMAGKKRKTRFVTHLATPSFLVERLNRHEQSGVRTHIVDWLERIQTSQSDAIVSETDALAKIVCRAWHIPRTRVVTIAQGVDFSEHYAAQADKLPSNLRDIEYLLYFGRLEKRKGVHILADALPNVLASYPDLHVVFAGNDQMYKGQPFQAYIEERNVMFLDRLHFYPRLPPENLFPIIAHSLLVVLPSLWENLANTGLESLNMGKPVVATHGSGFAEVIEDGVSGLLVEPGDTRALQHTLVSILADRARLSAMACAAKRRGEDFAMAKKARELAAFFEALRESAQRKR